MPRAASKGPWLAMTLAIAACGGSTTASSPVLTSLAVTLAPSTIQVGQAATASAVGHDQFGGAIAVSSINWTSSAPGVAMVNGAGIVHGITVGQATISASVGAVSTGATLTVTPPSASIASRALPARVSGIRPRFRRALAIPVSTRRSDPFQPHAAPESSRLPPRWPRTKGPSPRR